MRPGRTRLWCGVLLLAAAVSVAGATAASVVWWGRANGPWGCFAAAGRGVLSIGAWTPTSAAPSPAGFKGGRLDDRLIPFVFYIRDEGLVFNGYLLGVHRINGFGVAAWWLDVVLWPWPILLGGAGWLALRSGRRLARQANVGACPSCGYDLTGLAEGKPCPECGGTRIQTT